MNIVIYEGIFQYGVVDCFAEDLKQAFEKLGHKVYSIDTAKNEDIAILNNLLRENKIDLAIGFNAIGYEMKMDNRSIYDVFNIHFLGIFLDDPCYHSSRLAEPINNYLVSFVDEKHVDYVEQTFPFSHKINFFLPHAGIKNIENIKEEKITNFENYKKIKDIDIFISATNLSQKIPWGEIDNFPDSLFNDIIKLLKEDENLCIHEAFEIIFKKEKISFSQISKPQMANILALASSYFRGLKREKIIKKICQSGLKIVLCGKGWDNLGKEYSNVDYAGEKDIKEVLTLIKKAKIVLNINPNFTRGGHERIFTAMLHNAVVFTDSNSYLEQEFKDKKEIIYYSQKGIEKDISKLKGILNNPKELYEISKSAKCIAEKSFTWEQRATKILQMLTLAKVMDS